MFHLLRPLPKKIYLACSGGIDSRVSYDFLSKNHDVTIAHFLHSGDEFGLKERNFLLALGAPIVLGDSNTVKEPRQSLEEFWRIERYKFFHGLDGTVVTAHHLDDVVETWIWSSLHGEGKLIPYSNQNVVRPFLATPKSEFVSWAERKNLTWIDDPSNTNTKFMRNFIRHELMEKALVVNPGLQTTIKKKVLRCYNGQNS